MKIERVKEVQLMAMKHLKEAFRLWDWNITLTVESKSVEDDEFYTNAEARWLYPYKKGYITTNSIQTENTRRAFDVMAHEMLHLVVSPVNHAVGLVKDSDKEIGAILCNIFKDSIEMLIGSLEGILEPQLNKIYRNVMKELREKG